jgi:hypothetical protein
MSLFAFQDIITSVTAIMILLVLILTLELITKVDSVSVAPDDRRVAKELQASVSQLRERLVLLRAEAAGVTNTAKRVASQSVADVDADTRSAQRRNETLGNAVVSLKADVEKARDRRRAAEQDFLHAEKQFPAAMNLAAKASQDAAAAAAIEKRNVEEKSRQKDVENELADSPQFVSTLVFNPAPGQILTPILAELSEGGVSVLGAAQEGVLGFGWGVLGPPNGFTKWLDSRDRTREYVVVLLRPSGLDKLDPTKEAIVAKGFEVGLELVSEDMDIVLAEAHQPGS